MLLCLCWGQSQVAGLPQEGLSSLTQPWPGDIGGRARSPLTHRAVLESFWSLSFLFHSTKQWAGDFPSVAMELLTVKAPRRPRPGV